MREKAEKDKEKMMLMSADSPGTQPAVSYIISVHILLIFNFMTSCKMAVIGGILLIYL